MSDRISEGSAMPAEERVCALFITDDPKLADFYQLKLSTDGYDVRIGGRDWNWPNDLEPDLIFLDVDDGSSPAVNTWQRLRGKPRVKPVPVVLLTNQPERLRHDRRLRLGPNDLLMRIVRSSAGIASKG
jgi:DNA-binding response OmpR family regulator